MLKQPHRLSGIEQVTSKGPGLGDEVLSIAPSLSPATSKHRLCEHLVNANHQALCRCAFDAKRIRPAPIRMKIGTPQLSAHLNDNPLHHMAKRFHQVGSQRKVTWAGPMDHADGGRQTYQVRGQG